MHLGIIKHSLYCGAHWFFCVFLSDFVLFVRFLLFDPAPVDVFWMSLLVFCLQSRCHLHSAFDVVAKRLPCLKSGFVRLTLTAQTLLHRDCLTEVFIYFCDHFYVHFSVSLREHFCNLPPLFATTLCQRSPTVFCFCCQHSEAAGTFCSLCSFGDAPFEHSDIKVSRWCAF